jgi:hypothetical protein
MNNNMNVNIKSMIWLKMDTCQHQMMPVVAN